MYAYTVKTGQQMTVTFKRITNGEFEVYKDGVITKYHIFNSSQGVSGLGNNVYGLEDIETRKIVFPGSLQQAKKVVTYWLSKN